ncbi:hypothetical protein JW960_16215 [candidate division KSB1 bacterium]|nr:hypothetical protein [candidate division KSB1 bacterium]
MRQKLVFTILFVALVIASFMPSAFATETRVQTMGGVGYFIQDNSNIFYFPGTINKYSNQVVSELRVKNTDNSYSVGAHLPFGASGDIYGIYLNQPINMPADLVSDITPHLTLDRSATLFFGRKLTDYDLGLLFSFATDRWSDDTGADKEEESARHIGIGAGISNEMMDAGLKVELPSITWKEGQEKDHLGGFAIGLDGRYFIQQTSTMQLVPFGMFYYGSGAREYDPGSGADKTEIDYKQMNMKFAIAANYKLNKNNIAVLALEVFGMDKTTSDQKNVGESIDKTTTMPGLYLGIESTVKPWLVGRIGAQQLYQSESNEVKPEGGTKAESSDYMNVFNVSFGLGIKLGSFALDASLNEGVLFDGPHFISGYANNITHRLSIIYDLSN